MTSRTLYIDANCASSRKESVKNNRYHYPLEDALNLPIGTQVSLNTSLINLQGTQGNSITLDTDFEDEMLVGYYLTDTFYEVPCIKVAESDNKNVLGGSPNQRPIGLATSISDAMARLNYEFSTGLQVDDNTMETIGFQYTQSGGTEAPFPMVRVQHLAADGALDDRVIVTPVVHKVKLFLKAGTYSVDDFAEQLSNQINGRGNKFFKDKANVDYFAENHKAQFVQSNEQVVKTFALCNPPQTQTAASGSFSFPFYRSQLFNYSQESEANRKDETALDNIWFSGDDLSDTAPLSVGQVSEFIYDKEGEAFMEDGTTPAYQRVIKGVGLTPQHYNEILEIYKTLTEEEILANPTDENPNDVNKIHFNVFCQSLARNEKGVEVQSIIMPQSLKPDITGEKANAGKYPTLSIGSFDFQVNFDNQKSIFNLSTLHQPRRQPTNDLLANTMPNPSAVSVYSKRSDEALLTSTSQNTQKFPLAGTATEADELYLNTNQYGQSFTPLASNVAKVITPMMNKIMSRLSGCFVINWSVKTSQAERTYESTGKPFFENFANFEDYFNRADEAELAWNKTLWSRLGFGFNQICSERAFEEHNIAFVGTNKQKLRGFTTDMKVTASVIPSVSTLYNPLALPGGTDDPDKVDGGTLGVGTGYSQNITPEALSAAETEKGNIKSFLSSFYSRAVMAPVVTAEVPISAIGLPQLEEDGYLVITSNSFSKTDTLKKKTPGMLLDMVPISALNSTDFIQNRNMLTHTLTNSVVLNELNINVLRPNLTDVSLKENSTCLVQITIPETIPTPLIQNAVLQEEAKQVLKPSKNEEQPAKK